MPLIPWRDNNIVHPHRLVLRPFLLTHRRPLAKRPDNQFNPVVAEFLGHGDEIGGVINHLTNRLHKNLLYAHVYDKARPLDITMNSTTG